MTKQKKRSNNQPYAKKKKVDRLEREIAILTTKVYVMSEKIYHTDEKMSLLFDRVINDGEKGRAEMKVWLGGLALSFTTLSIAVVTGLIKFFY